MFWSRTLLLKIPEKNRLHDSCILKTDEFWSKQPLVQEAEMLTLFSTDKLLTLPRLRRLLDIDLWKRFTRESSFTD